jgi:2',3'-cyclic-nucleotide 2'-phosphodiesterase / 3'-nucleotidase
MYFQYDYYEGIEYTIIVNKYVSNEIVDLKFNGFEVNDNMSFLIAMNSYRYLGGGYQTWQRDLEVIKEYPIDVAEMIIDYITREQRIKVNFKDNIKVLKGMN